MKPSSNSGQAVISGIGGIDCTAAANVSLTVCIDYRTTTSSTWLEGQCDSQQETLSASLTGTTLLVGVSCFGQNGTRDYRLRVSGLFNGKTLTEIQSEVAITPTCG